MENVTHTQKLLISNIEQAMLNRKTGNFALMLKDLNMAAILAEKLGREIVQSEMEAEAAIRTK